jgi:hypothetical protein
MKKSIGMFEDLISRVNLGLKTQTIRLVKPNPLYIFDFEKQFEAFTHSKSKYKNFSHLTSVIDNSKYLIGDIVSIEDSKILIEISSVELNRVFNISENLLEREGIKSQPHMTLPNTLVYFDYLNNIYNLNTINESYKTLMIKCYGTKVIESNPFVFIYQFKLIEQTTSD